MRKKNKRALDYFSNRQAFIQAVTISGIVNCVLIVGALYGQTRGITAHWFGYVKFFLWHLISNIILYYLLFRFNFMVIKYYHKEFGMLFISIAGTMLICFVASPFLTRLQWYVIGDGRMIVDERFTLFNLGKDLILGVIVILVTRNLYIGHKREQAIIANQKLIEENIRTRFEALKNQLDPHFLFNSLNTLNGLIGVDDDKAQEYVDNLSSVFRYTLNNKNIQTLEEELLFVESFLSLLRIRYGDNLHVEYDVDDKYRHFEIMPISIQLLIENAVKHNVISNKSPLTIHVATTPHESITVSNRINPRSEKITGSGVGLANLSDRYKILFKKTVNIAQTDGMFTVEIPLVAGTQKN